IRHYILTARRMGIKVLPPDITKSGVEFTPDGEQIRFGMASVKNVGVSVVEAIITARKNKSESDHEGADCNFFTSLEDFLTSVDAKVINRKTLESLILVGAFQCFGYSRKQLFNNVDEIIGYANKARQQKETGQVSLFAMMS